MATFSVNFGEDKLRAEVSQDQTVQAQISSRPIKARMEVTNSSEFNADFSQNETMDVDMGEVFEVQSLDGDYNSLENKPKINGVTLVGDKTTEDLGIQGVTDHRELTHRDALDQHPIEAITDLEPELAVRPSRVLTNMDIQRILNS